MNIKGQGWRQEAGAGQPDSLVTRHVGTGIGHLGSRGGGSIATAVPSVIFH